MGQRFESKPANQRLRSLLSSPISSKGLLVQALTYPFALPAIANPLPQPVPNAPSPVAVLDLAPQNIDASFEMDGLTEAGQPQKPAFVTRLEQSTKEDALNHPILLAGPQDFNPGLSDPEPPSEPDEPLIPNNPQLDNPTADPPFSPDNALPQTAEPIPVENTPVDPANTESDKEQQPFVTWNDLEVGINSDFKNFGESSWSVLPVLSGELANGNQIEIATGFSQFEQDNFESVGHVPLTLSWQGNVNDVELNVSGGVDFFNRLPVDTHASAIATAPIGEDALVSVAVEQGPYLFNAQTLENEISRWQYGPELYWQIAPKLSLFSKVQLGNYSDGNWEQQSFSRLERTIGEEASVSLSFLNQSFQENLEKTSGYFSPPDFLVVTAELSWQEQITEGLSCGFLGSVGQQRLEGEWALAYSGQALCTVDVASALQVDLGYQFSNVSKDQSALVEDSAFSSQQIIGGIRVKF